MLKKPCLNCGTPTPNSRCRPCQAEWERTRRPNTRGRGYSGGHQKARGYLIATLPHPCAYGCGTTLTTPQQLIAAHRVDGDPTQGWIPACRTCNENAKHRR